MKNTLILALISLTFYSITGCQKDYAPIDIPPSTTPGGTTPGGVTGQFTAKVNGVQFTGDKVATAVRASGLINITGAATNGKIITITLTDSGVHNYQLQSQTINAAAYVEATNGIAFTSNASDNPTLAGGTCTVTNIDTVNKKISGTFKFKVLREIDQLTRDITEGSFTGLTYQTDAVSPTNNIADTFKVKLDGVDWINYSLNAVTVPFIDKISIISNRDASGNTVVGFTFDKSITPGSYQWDFLSVAAIYNSSSFATTGSLVASDGNLTILEHNLTTKRIRGTFNFNAAPLMAATPVASFTQGYFSVVYQ